MAHGPQLAPYARYRWDKVRQQHQIVYPEAAMVLNDTGAEIVKLCDGRDRDKIIEELRERFGDVDIEADVEEFLNSLGERGLLVDVS